MQPLRVDGRRTEVTYPRFALPDPSAAEDLDLHVRAELDRVLSFDGRVRGACAASLASETLVSVVCDLTTNGGREQPPGAVAGAATFRIAGRRVMRMDPAEAFVPGTRLGAALCAKAIGHPLAADDNDSCYGQVVALSPTAVIGRIEAYDERHGRSIVRRVEIPYADLASLIRRDGALAWAAGAAPATMPSEVAPREGGGFALTVPLSPADVADAYRRADAPPFYGMFAAVPVDAGTMRLAVPLAASTPELVAVAAVTGTSDPINWGPPTVALSAVRAAKEVVLRSSPNGDVVGTLPPGTYAVLFDGVVAGTDSVRSSLAGLPAYVGASRSIAGWATGVDFTGDDLRPEVVIASQNFAQALPTAERDAVMRDVLRVYVTAMHARFDGERVALLGRSDAAGVSYAGVYGEPHADRTPGTWGPIFFGHVAGAATTMRVFEPTPGAESLVAVASRVATDPPGVERWSFFALGATEPCFTTSLRTAATVPDAERATVITDDATGLGVASGGTTAQYAWNGTTFTAPP